MNAKLSRSGLFMLGSIVLGVLALPACKDDEGSDDPTPTPSTAEPTTAPEPAPSAQPPTALTVDDGQGPPAEGIEPKIKAAVDNQEPDEGFSGTNLSVPKGVFTVATGWKTTKKDDFQVATSADGKSIFAAGSTGTASPTAQLDAAATAMGLTECKWAATESATLGKDKLVATVADGICKKDGNDWPAAYAAINSENILAMASWAKGAGDTTAIWNSFRSVKKAAAGTGGGGIAACCQALQQNAASAPPQQKGAYLAAFGACNAVRNSPQGRAALAGVRSMLAGLNMPAACR